MSEKNETLLTEEEQANAKALEVLVEPNETEQKPEFELEAIETPQNLKDYQDSVVDEVLIFPLPDTERANLADDLVELNNKKRDKEKEFDIMKKKFKAELQDIEASMDAVLDVIENGQECRVTCTKRVHFDRQEVEFLYNGKVMKTRKILDTEKNPQLDGVENVGDSFANEADAQEAGFGDKVISPDEGNAIIESMSDDTNTKTNSEVEQDLDNLEQDNEMSEGSEMP